MHFVSIVSLSIAMLRRKHKACIDNQTNSYVLQELSVRPTGQYTLVVTHFIATYVTVVTSVLLQVRGLNPEATIITLLTYGANIKNLNYRVTQQILKK